MKRDDEKWLDASAFGDLAVRIDETPQPTPENKNKLRWKLTPGALEGPTFRIRLEPRST